MFGVYYLSVSTLGGSLAELIEAHIFGENGIPFIAESFLNKVACAPWLTSLIVDGIIAGVGAVLTFVPQIIVLFIFLSFLEDCGYMSRIAFIMDKLFRKFGLSGKSFIPILVGTGCGVPGIMSSRTIEKCKRAPYDDYYNYLYPVRSKASCYCTYCFCPFRQSLVGCSECIFYRYCVNNLQWYSS